MVKVIYDTSEETRIREIARLREKALHDEASALKHAYEKGFAIGFARGMEKGMEKARTEIIEKLKASGMTDEQIRKILS